MKIRFPSAGMFWRRSFGRLGQKKLPIMRTDFNMELARRRNEVHSSKDVEMVMSDMLTRLRSKMLGVAAKMAAVLANRDKAYIEQSLTEEIHSRLMELSEYSPTMFTEVAEDTEKTIELFKKIARQSLRPLPNLSVSDWADTYRMLSNEASSEPGRWRTDRAPYQRDIMNTFTQPRIWKVTVMSAAQIGKSDCLNNIIGRYAHLAPAPIMMIQPTIDMAQDYSKSRIATMIRDTKVLRNIFHEAKSRESNNTILSKLFPGGRLIMGGANSPAGLASRPVKILLADEVDRFPASAGTEGDPVDLAAKRMTNLLYAGCRGWKLLK